MCLSGVFFICRRKWNRKHWGNFQSDFIYQYIDIFKSNSLQKIKKWNQFGLNTCCLCMYSSWLINGLFVKKLDEESQQKGTKTNHFINKVGRCCKDVGVFFFGRGHHVLRGLTKTEELHTQKKCEMMHSKKQHKPLWWIIEICYNQGMQCCPLYK